MKKRLLHFFAVFMAMAIAIPIANAAASDYKINAPTKNWTTTFSIPDDNSRQLAISKDGVPYTLSETDKFSGYVATYRITSSGNQLVNLGWTSTGAANAFDDAGNYVTHSAGTSGPTQTVTTSPASKFCVREGPVNHTATNSVFPNGSGIDMNGYTAGKVTLYLDATGDVRHGNGYIWFAQTGTSTNITCLVVKNVNGTPTVSGTKSFDTGIVSGGGNDNYLNFYDTSNESAMKCILQVRGVGIYDVTLNATAGTFTSVNAISCTSNAEYNSLGAHIFMMRGRKLLCRNTRRVGDTGAARNRYSEFEILDITDSYTNPTKIATIDHLPGKYSNGASIGDGHNTGSFIQTYKHSEDKVEIFAYVQGSGCSSYIITASPITAPVSNLKAEVGGVNNNEIKVSWGKPSQGTATKYAISYSINGGAFSAEEELNGTSKTYSNQADATYAFKVRAYFGGSSTWGEATTSNSVTVVNPKAPVTNVQVHTSSASPYSAVVNWEAPAEGTASKYAVSYSADGGSTWSTAGYTFTTTKLWEVVGTLGTAEAPAGKSIAVSNNMMYVAAPDKYGTMSYVSESLGREPASWPNFSSGYASYNWGYAMDNDDAGNIVARTNGSLAKAATRFTIYKAGTTDGTIAKEIDLTGDYLPGARADFIAAQGNLLSAEGGYVWIAPNTGHKIMRIKVVNGELAGVDTWTHSLGSDNNTNQILLRPLSDGRLYMHFRGTGYYIITLPPVGEAITSSMMQNITVSGTAYKPISLVSSDMFILQGHTFHVRNDGAQDQSIGIVVKNLTEDGNGDITYTPFDGIDTKGEENGLTGSGGYGSFVRAVKVDDYNYDVYSYSMNHGVTVYRVSAKATYIKTDKLASLSYNYTSSTDGDGKKVQNIELTWEAPKDATPSSYKIYRDGSLLATVDASSLSYTDSKVNQNYTYQVVPIFIGTGENKDLGLEVTTTEVETILYAPIITETRSYDGYSITQIFYQMPVGNKVRPAYFNIYRNGALLEGNVTAYNYIDDNLPQKSTDEIYEYKIEAVYSATYDNTTRMSNVENVTVTSRDGALTGYMLQEVYNVPISQNFIGNWQPNFDNYDYYRQGHFKDGYWYIAQLSDNLSKEDQGILNGAVNQSGIDGSTGGVIAIKATEESDVRAGIVGKVITSDEFASAGLAIDDKGTILMRHNNLEQLKATVPTGTNWYSGMYDAYDRRITEVALYTRNDDGSYSTTPTIVDLSALWTTDDWINNMNFTGLPSYGQVIGRSDYFNMYGDVMSAEGGFLILSPSWTRTVFKVKIANGAYHSHETLEFHDYEEDGVTHKVLTGTENYGFKIDGRDAWMAQIRSNAYFGIHGVSEDHLEEAHDHTWHAIYDVDSRVNNSGGTSIVAFGREITQEDIDKSEGKLTADALGKDNGEIFLITPACMFSKNTGDFIVTRGIKEYNLAPSADAELAPPMPVAQWRQTNTSTNEATNANGNWFHAEVGTYESATGENAECVYIYQYVPGVRFAKYRLIPDNHLEMVNPTLDIATAYNDDKTEITHFSGVATWNRPVNFGTTDAENASVWVKSYTFELLNAKGEKIYEAEVPETKDDEGNPTIKYTFDYVADKKIENVDNCDLDFQTYTARVAVNYEFAKGSVQQSLFNYAIDDNTYDAVAPDFTNVAVFKQANGKVQEWVEKDGEWVIEDKLIDAYRVEVNFDKPDHNEPVSYYTLRAIRNKTVNGVNVLDTIEITSFDLHLGKVNENGVTRAKYETVSQIPGTYDFVNNKAPYYLSDDQAYGKLGESQFDGVLTWHHVVPAGTYNSANARASEMILEPNNWTFEVVAHYAARNRYIAKDAADDNKADEIILTGVEVIGEDEASSLHVYPIPATAEITINSAEVINSIVVYNEAGVEVMSLAGNGEATTTVNIEDLATGYYFVKVNNQAPVKIIKK